MPLYPPIFDECGGGECNTPEEGEKAADEVLLEIVKLEREQITLLQSINDRIAAEITIIRNTLDAFALRIETVADNLCAEVQAALTVYTSALTHFLSQSFANVEFGTEEIISRCGSGVISIPVPRKATDDEDTGTGEEGETTPEEDETGDGTEDDEVPDEPEESEASAAVIVEDLLTAVAMYKEIKSGKLPQSLMGKVEWVKPYADTTTNDIVDPIKLAEVGNYGFTLDRNIIAG